MVTNFLRLVFTCTVSFVDAFTGLEACKIVVIGPFGKVLSCFTPGLSCCISARSACVECFVMRTKEKVAPDTNRRCEVVEKGTWLDSNVFVNTTGISSPRFRRFSSASNLSLREVFLRYAPTCSRSMLVPLHRLITMCLGDRSR